MQTLFAIIGVLFLILLLAALLCKCVSSLRDHTITALDLGAWMWGTLLVVFVVACLWVIFYAAQHIYIPKHKDDPVTFSSENMLLWFPGLYHVVVEFSTLIGALLAFGGLAWAHFFTTDKKEDKPKNPVQNLVLIDQETKYQLYLALKDEFGSETKTKAEPDGGGQPAARSES